mmetsp:Transcript_39182/g.92043  ORF Transcript_39182/g.92043 Transcript_39182/m.92043 type:complete len:82 (-) Transcript_39182:7444-7689(-)
MERIPTPCSERLEQAGDFGLPRKSVARLLQGLELDARCLLVARLNQELRQIESEQLIAGLEFQRAPFRLHGLRPLFIQRER